MLALNQMSALLRSQYQNLTIAVNFSNSSFVPMHFIIDQQITFQEKLNQIAAEMERRNNSFYGLGATLVGRDYYATSTENRVQSYLNWFSKLRGFIYGNTPLHQAVRDMDIEVVKHFTETMNVNALNRNGLAPLHLAIELGWVEGTELLLKAGADLNLSANGNAPLKWAFIKRQIAIIKLLRKQGAVLDFGAEIYKSSTFWDVKEDFFASELISYLLEEKMLNEIFKVHFLFCAMAYDDGRAVKILLQHNADILSVWKVKNINALALATESSAGVKKQVDLFLGEKFKEKKNEISLKSQTQEKNTILFGSLMRQIIESEHEVSTVLRKNKLGQTYYNIVLNDKEYNMYEIIADMDWEKIYFDESDFAMLQRSAYFNKFNKLLGDLQQYSDLEDRVDTDKAKYAELSPFEKGLIYSYTDKMSHIINPFLKGEPLPPREVISPVSAFIKQQPYDGIHCWLYSAFLANAINKIPSEMLEVATCRGQSERDKMLRKNHPAFISTSSSFTLCAKYALEAKGRVLVFSNIIGKDITPLSYYWGEQEYLSTPAMIDSVGEKFIYEGTAFTSLAGKQK